MYLVLYEKVQGRRYLNTFGIVIDLSRSSGEKACYLISRVKYFKDKMDQEMFWAEHNIHDGERNPIEIDEIFRETEVIMYDVLKNGAIIRNH